LTEISCFGEIDRRAQTICRYLHRSHPPVRATPRTRGGWTIFGVPGVSWCDS
jgi:hypothetical protein